jgi:hypothetical protein
MTLSMGVMSHAFTILCGKGHKLKKECGKECHLFQKIVMFILTALYTSDTAKKFKISSVFVLIVK